MLGPDSCDTFVALPSATTNGCVIFGKNSDRQRTEVQEVVYVPAAEHGGSQQVQCTYIGIPQVAHTHAVMLSKPAWMWGAEMGANEHGVVIGNEAVWTKESGEEDLQEKLLGMDLVRLGLERGSSAREAMDVITSLLQEHGQGGPCFEEPGFTTVSYHNSYILADPTEAWVLETAGKHWAAEKITDGVRNISNQLSIGTKIDAMSEGLQEHAKDKGYWDGSGYFDFAKIFSAPPAIKTSEEESPENRFKNGKKLMEDVAGSMVLTSMMEILRNEECSICRVGKSGMSTTTASMVSVLYPADKTPSHHWFTASPNPQCSVFKPFIFCPNVDIGKLTISPTYGADDPAKVKPRFEKQVNRMHPLYKRHETLNSLPGDDAKNRILNILKSMESQCIHDLEEYLSEFGLSKSEELQDLFKDSAESECKFYSQ